MDQKSNDQETKDPKQTEADARLAETFGEIKSHVTLGEPNSKVSELS